MKKLLVITCMMFGYVCTAAANGDTKPVTGGNKTAVVDKKTAVLAEQRANHLSDKMIVALGLNNYQSRKLREINKDIVVKKLAVEKQYAGNQAVIDQKCKEICATRDAKLESVLSTKQYNEYFGDRKVYNETEQKFMAGLNEQPANSQAAQTETVSLN